MTKVHWYCHNKPSVCCVVCVCRCWPTEWTCPMVRWGAWCAAAPDRPCLPASWCDTQISTPLLASTWCTTLWITSSWLHQFWLVLFLMQTPAKRRRVFKTHCSFLFQMPHEAASQNSAELASDLTVNNHAIKNWVFFFKCWILNICPKDLKVTAFAAILLWKKKSDSRRGWRCYRRIFSLMMTTVWSVCTVWRACNSHDVHPRQTHCSTCWIWSANAI